MKKRFIVIVGEATHQQLAAYQTDVVKSGKVNWWHWLPNAWLFTTDIAAVTAATIRDELKGYFPGITTMVFEFRADGSESWSGFGPTKPPSDMVEWLNRNWKP